MGKRSATILIAVQGSRAAEVATSLHDRGYVTLRVSSGPDAVAALGVVRADAIVIDDELPERERLMASLSPSRYPVGVVTVDRELAMGTLVTAVDMEIARLAGKLP